MKCSLKTLILTVAIMTMKTMKTLNITMKMIMEKEIVTLTCNKNKKSGIR